MKHNTHSSASILFGKKTRMLLFLPVSTALMLACAEKNSNRKDNLSRLHSRPQQSVKAGAPGQNQKPGTGTSGNGTTAPGSSTSGQPQDLSTGLKSSMATSEKSAADDSAPKNQEDALQSAIDKKNQLCRITNSPKLAADYRAQQFCEGVVVTIDANGDIKQLHSLENISSQEIKPESRVIDDKTGVAHILIQSRQSTGASTKNSKDIKTANVQNKSKLILSYSLPEKFEDIDESSIKVKINNTQLSAIPFLRLQEKMTALASSSTEEKNQIALFSASNKDIKLSSLDSLPTDLTGKFLFVKTIATGSAKIQLLDVRNVNFDLEIEYKLKPAQSTTADQKTKVAPAADEQTTSATDIENLKIEAAPAK